MQSDDIITVPNYQYFDDNYDITLYRGLKKTPPLDIAIPFKFRETSKTTPALINYYINERLTELYGLPIRNLLYTTNDYKQAECYGEPYTVKPVGNDFKIFYGVGIYDLTADLNLFGNEVDDYIYQIFEKDVNIQSALVDDNDLTFILDILLDTMLTATNKERYEANKKIAIDDLGEEHTKDQIKYIIDLFERSMDEIVENILKRYKIKELMPNEKPPIGEFMLYAPDGFVLTK